jgi:hypothetical protein
MEHEKGGTWDITPVSANSEHSCDSYLSPGSDMKIIQGGIQHPFRAYKNPPQPIFCWWEEEDSCHHVKIEIRVWRGKHD